MYVQYKPTSCKHQRKSIQHPDMWYVYILTVTPPWLLKVFMENYERNTLGNVKSVFFRNMNICTLLYADDAMMLVESPDNLQ